MTDADRADDVDMRKLRTLIKRYALEGRLTADEVLSLGSNASDEQAAWARALVEEMPEKSKPWAYEYGQGCTNPCCDPWQQPTAPASPGVTWSDLTGGADPWAAP